MLKKANKFLDLIRKITRDLEPDSISVRLNRPAVTAEQEKFLADNQIRGNIKNGAKIGLGRRLLRPQAENFLRLLPGCLHLNTASRKNVFAFRS